MDNQEEKKRGKGKKNRLRKDKAEALSYLHDFLSRYGKDERVLKMQNHIHHPGVTAYEHSLKVVSRCVDIVNRFHFKVDWENLLMAALLHDFYLYDFKGHHAFVNGIVHPYKASKNAVEQFGVCPHVKRCIRTHMFPGTFWWIPTSREAWILTLADKSVAAREYRANRKRKREERKKGKAS